MTKSVPLESPRLLLILIDDDPAARAAVRHTLERGDPSFRVEEYDTGAAGLARINEGPVDCVLLDHSLPDMPGLELLAQLQAAERDVPIIMLTSAGDDELAVECLRRGASDYVTKTKLEPEGLASKVRIVRRLHETSVRARAAETELRDSVEKLRRAVAARDSVLAVVSHDLRGPLNNIELAMGLLEANIPAPQRALAIASVHRAIVRADRLISDLLDVARLSGGAIDLVMEAVDPVQVVDTAIADVQPALQQYGLTIHRIHREIDQPIPPILGDRNRVIQILDNLLRNAIKYGPRGGEVHVGLTRRATAIEFWVRDQGPGLDPDIQAHVFDRFWRARGGKGATSKVSTGSGLGLAIAQGLVHSHGGQIGVESSPGAGARFHFTIPLAPD